MPVQFADPRWLWLGLGACAALTVLLVRAQRQRARVAAAFAGGRPVSTVSGTRRRVKEALLLVGVAASFVALARPLAGFRWEKARHQGIDLMFAVDTSKSMGAPDLRPDRLTRAKLAVHDLLRKFPGERVGLIAFAGDAFVQAPMTVDQAIFEESLDALDTSVIPRGGTDVGAAVRLAQQAMASEPARRKVLVLLSDGEDLQGDAVAAAKEAARHGLVVYTIGVGTPAGELIPVVGAHGQQQLVRDAAGQAVRSRLDEKTMVSIAQSTGGAYAALGPSGRGLETLYQEHLAQLPQRTVEERSRKVYTERFQFPLTVALACLLLELVLGERRRVARAAVVVAVLIGAARPASAAPTAPANAPRGAVSSYNDGTAAYQKKDFAAARDRFEVAVRSRDIALQSDAYYDLGNARYRFGQGLLPHDQAATIDAWKSALTAYDGALALNPKDADAKFNRDVVARHLAALQKQQKQPQSPQKQPQDQQSQGQQQKQDQQGQGQHQKQEQQGQGQQQKQEQQGQGQHQKQDQQRQAGKQGEPNQPATPSSQQNGPSDNPPQAKPGAAGQPRQKQPPAVPQPGATTPANFGEPREPTPAPAGALTRGEAVQLLDSLHGDLRRMPLPNVRGDRPNEEDRPAKDW